MSDDDKNLKKMGKLFNPTDHLANERTFLAWIRTNLGIMAFGFVVEKFGLFLQQIAFFLSTSGLSTSKFEHSKLQSHSSVLGISLIALGTLLCIFSFAKYKKTEMQINRGQYHSSNILNALLAFLVFSIGIFLIFYLIESHSLLSNSH